MKNKKTIILIVTIILIAIGVILLIRRDSTSTISVKTVIVEERTIEQTVSSSGEVISEKSADLKFGSAGKLASVNVQEGDEVKKGTLLAYLTNYALSQTAQASKDARDVTLRDKELYVEQYESDWDAVGGEDEYNISLRRLDELISAAEATYQAKLAIVRDSYIYAPFDGVVLDILFDEGENVLTTETIIKVADLTNLQFEIELDQEDYGLVREGQEVTINLDTYEKYDFMGNVIDLPFYADGTGTSVFIVKISFKDVGELKPLLGTTGDVDIVVSSTPKPVNSLYYDELFYDEEDKPYVWGLQGGLITKKHVEVGLEGDIYTEIKGEINETIVAGLNDDVEVKEGYKAKVVR